MKKSTATIVTILTLSAAIGVSACSSPVQQGSASNGKDSRVIQAEGESIVGEVKVNQASSESSPEALEVKSTLDGFYASLADREKAKGYVSLVSKLQEDPNVTIEDRKTQGKEFFAEDIKHFDLEKVTEDEAFYVLSVATIASTLVPEDYPKITVPVDAISVEGDRATVDMAKAGNKSSGSDSAGNISLVKRDGTWLISSLSVGE